MTNLLALFTAEAKNELIHIIHDIDRTNQWFHENILRRFLRFTISGSHQINMLHRSREFSFVHFLICQFCTYVSMYREHLGIHTSYFYDIVCGCTEKPHKSIFSKIEIYVIFVFKWSSFLYKNQKMSKLHPASGRTRTVQSCTTHLCSNNPCCVKPHTLAL